MNKAFTFQSSGRPTPLPWLRLAGGTLCLMVSLLAIFPAPTTFLWMVAIAVTEWGYFAAPLPLLLFLRGWRASWGSRLGAMLGLAASALLLITLFRAARVAEGVPAALEGAFGESTPRFKIGAPPRWKPFAATDLFFGIASPEVQHRQEVYSTPGGNPLSLDLYLPRMARAPAPGVIVVHGGGWQNGDSGEFQELNSYLAARGYLVASINYRLAPKFPFPAAREDLNAAIAYLKAHAADFNLDPDRLVLLGRSAGGQLALLAAYTAHDPAIRGVVALYSPTDLSYSYAHPANRSVIDSRGLLERYLGGPPDRVRAAYDDASPIRFAGPRSPPTLLIHGGRDELVLPAESERLNVRLGEAGVRRLLVRLPWATHGCDIHFNGPCGQITTYAIERFLGSVMR